MRILALLLAFFPLTTFGFDRLSALSMIESGDDDRMVGRAGEISRYQILVREWRSVTNSTRFTDPKVAVAVTQKLIEKRVATFRSIFRRDPTDFEFYGLWNAPAQVYRGKVSPVVAERCARYANLCAVEDRPVRVAAAHARPAEPVAPAITTASLARSARSTAPAGVPGLLLAHSALYQ
jgi:hypothetical protein